jgi:hypothetical protein
MHSREQIMDALDRQESDCVAYWNAFDTDAFFRRIGSSWSPAETVRHLSKSIRPVAKALATPKIMLRVMFGKASRASMSYDDLVARYQNALAEGGQAGRFAPSAQSDNDLEAWRVKIMESFTHASRDLRTAIPRWPERKLDLLQLPHPLIGKLTVREMLFFTLYHQRHHMAVVERKLRSLSDLDG